MNVRILSWDDARADATAIRERVFVLEQSVPRELEMDDEDEHCEHALAYDDAGRAVGTGRLLPDGHIGRMAVFSETRRTGVGSTILAALVKRAQDRGMTRLVLHAQKHAVAFYARHGFEPHGEEFLEAGIPHVAMVRDVSRSSGAA